MLRIKNNIYYVIVTALLLLSTVANAGGTITTTQTRNPSFYVDAGIGINIFSSPTDTINQGTTSAAPGILLDNRNKRVVNSSTAASLGFGYAFPVNNWFNLGARVFARYANNFGSIALSRQIFNSGSTLQSNESNFKLRNFVYGIDLTPNIDVGANQFLTGIFGITFNRLTIDTINLIQANNNGIAGAIENTMRRSVVGTRLGFGLEELLNPHFSVYMHYIWTGYGTIHSLNLIDAPIVAGGNQGRFEGDTDINAQTHNVLVGLKYYFASQNFQAHLRRIVHHLNRFYVKFALGSLIPQYTVSNLVLATGAFPTYFLNRNQQGDPTLMGVLGLGDGLMIHHFYLGAEAILNIADRDSHSTYNIATRTSTFLSFNSDEIRIKLNTLEGAFDLKLGGIIAPQTLLVGRVGLAVNNLKLSDDLRAFNSASALDITETPTTHRTVVGTRFGIGLERLFSNSFGLTMNYIYTYYGHISAAGNSVTQGTVNLVSSTTARVGTHEATIGLNYYFS